MSLLRVLSGVAVVYMLALGCSQGGDEGVDAPGLQEAPAGMDLVSAAREDTGVEPLVTADEDVPQELSPEQKEVQETAQAFGDAILDRNLDGILRFVSEDFQSDGLDKKTFEAAVVQQIIYGNNPAVEVDLSNAQVKAVGTAYTIAPVQLKRAFGELVLLELTFVDELGEWRIVGLQSTAGIAAD